MAGAALDFNDTNFKTEVLEAKEPVVVDFWAPWCGPCRMLAPTIEQLAAEYHGTAKVGKLNTDESPQTAMAYGISSIPTVLIFKNGEIVDQMVGVQPKSRLQAAIDAAR